MRSLIGLLSVLLPTLAVGQSHEDPASTLRLTVKPLLCILDESTPQCNMSFLVIWQSDVSGYYCLFNDFVTAPLRCWSEERTGRLTEDRVVRNEFRYWMTERDGERRLAAVTVEVLRMDDGDRRRKRRTRHVWDLL